MSTVAIALLGNRQKGKHISFHTPAKFTGTEHMSTFITLNYSGIFWSLYAHCLSWLLLQLISHILASLFVYWDFLTLLSGFNSLLVYWDFLTLSGFN